MSSRLASSLLLALCIVSRTQAVSVDLSRYSADSIWRAANSKVNSRKDPDGTTVWRWAIGSGEAFLWLNEELPVHKELPKFSRFVYDVKFAEGRINQLWPRTVGQLAPPNDKVFCEWNHFYFTHPHGTWLTYQQIFDHPNWFAFPTAFSQPPADVSMDRAHVLGFACLPKGESCVVELRNCRLVTDVITVDKPYLTGPVGWPRRDDDVGGVVRYRTPYFVRNDSDRPVDVSAAVRSEHDFFEITVDPPRATIAAGQRERFDVLATLRPDPAKKVPPLSEETAVVLFVPDGQEPLAYRTETFCTLPIPAGARRMVLYTPDQVRELKQKPEAATEDAKFWMSVNLNGQTEIPHGIGHMLIGGIPAKCPKCKNGTLHVTSKWLEVACDACDHSEHHTRTADATWIATWSSIHGSGPSPLSLGRAYLVTGDERYAQKAIQLLKLLASRYASLPWHNAYGPEGWEHEEPATADARTIASSTRWGNSPSYGTNFMVQHLAELHDAIVDSGSWSEADRALVHDGLWVPVATELMKITPGISNMNDIINHDLVLAAMATGDANMLYRGTMHPMGVVARLADVSADGFSDEGGALNYHLAAAREWFPSIEMLLNSEIAFQGVIDRAVAALKMPLLRAALNGQAYCTGNSGAAWFAVPLDGDLFNAADRAFPATLWPRDRHYMTEPTLFRDAGWAILRSGSTPDRQVMVNLDFGRSHGHGDLDRMNLGLLAFGVPLSADPGSPYNFNTGASAGPAEGSMSGPFVANTVVVDSTHQLRGAGRLVEWDPMPAMQRVTAEITGVYPGVSWLRSVVLTDGLVIILDDLHSDKPHRYESAWHHYGAAVTAGDCHFADLPGPLGDGPYKELLNPRRLTGPTACLDWAVQGVHVRAWQPADDATLAYTAQTGVCWDNVRGLPVDGLFVRREGTAARFVTVLEPYRPEPRLTGVTVRHDDGGPVVILRLANSGGIREIRLANTSRE